MKKALVLLLFVAFLHVGTCLKCYVCSSYVKEDGCSDPFDQNKHKAEECDLPNAVCLKHLKPTGGSQGHIYRGCVLEDYCSNADATTIKYCETCDKGLCNSSSIVVPSLTLLAVFLIRCYI